jgi:hypothetical protein
MQLSESKGCIRIQLKKKTPQFKTVCKDDHRSKTSNIKILQFIARFPYLTTVYLHRLTSLFARILIVCVLAYDIDL